MKFMCQVMMKFIAESLVGAYLKRNSYLLNLFDKTSV